MEEHVPQTGWANIIVAVKSALGFFALVVLVAEVILGIMAQKATGIDFTILLVSMVGIVIALVVIVAIRAKELAPAIPYPINKFVTSEDGGENESKEPELQYEVFLSAPMASIETDEEYIKQRLEVKKVFDVLRANCGYRVFWAAEHCETKRDFDAMDSSIEDDLKALDDSGSFVMIYPEKILTSAIFEAGYALALNKPSVYFIRKHEDLPWLMRKTGDVYSYVRIHDESEWVTHNDIVRLVEKNDGKLFGIA